MTLPHPPAAAGWRAALGRFGALWLLLAAVWPAAAVAQSDDPYAVTVKIDATADTVVKARDKARLDGERKALGQLADTLGGGPGKGKVPKLDDNAITAMVASFEVADEHMSAVRYIADYTFHFRPADVQRVLHVSADAAAAAAAGAPAPGTPAAGAPPPAPVTTGKPQLVLPLYQVGTKAVLWDDPNPWRDGWSARQATDRLSVPLGDVEDVATIDAEKARTGDADTLAAIGKKYNADDVLVAFAAARGPAEQPAGLDVSVKHYRGGKLVDVHTRSLDANPGESADALFRRAADATAAAIALNWQGIAPQNDQQGSLVAVLPINGLDDWLGLRDRISGLTAVRKIELRMLSKQEATVEIGYAGDVEQLKSALAGLGLDLAKGDPAWRISRGVAQGGPSPTPVGAPVPPPPGSGR